MRFLPDTEVMMSTYAYLCVSTDQQDVNNQRHGLLVYANTHGPGPLLFVEDTASGRLARRDRAMGRLLRERGDLWGIGIHGVPRLARTPLSPLSRMTRMLSEVMAYDGFTRDVRRVGYFETTQHQYRHSSGPTSRGSSSNAPRLRPRRTF